MGVHEKLWGRPAPRLPSDVLHLGTFLHMLFDTVPESVTYGYKTGICRLRRFFLWFTPGCRLPALQDHLPAGAQLGVHGLLCPHCAGGAGWAHSCGLVREGKREAWV